MYKDSLNTSLAVYTARLAFKYITERGLPREIVEEIVHADNTMKDMISNLLEEHKERSRNNKFRREIF